MPMYDEQGYPDHDVVGDIGIYCAECGDKISEGFYCKYCIDSHICNECGGYLTLEGDCEDCNEEIKEMKTKKIIIKLIKD